MKGIKVFVKLLDSAFTTLQKGIVSEMTFELPCSPGHGLSMLKQTMQSDILRFVHETVSALKAKAQRSPLAYLIEGIETTLERYQDFEATRSTDINPFNANPGHRFNFDPKLAYTHDMKLLTFQLTALKKIRSEINSYQ